MNRKIPFSEEELRVVEVRPGFMGRPGNPIINTPVTPKENITALFWDKESYWYPLPGEMGYWAAPFYNDMLGRGGPAGTTDAFGIVWEWVESARGSIVHPGDPFLSNANEWPDKIHFPNLDEIDWKADVEKSQMPDLRFSPQMSLINGFWFERLISFMDFAPAATALVDEDQQDAVKSLFRATTDFACDLVDHIVHYYPFLDGFNIHDDWGAQKNPFFSMDIAYEFFVPYMRDLTDHMHSYGKYVTLHSCGNNEKRVQAFIDGGFDQWDPQPMNDTHALYEEFGDKMIFGIIPDQFDPEKTSVDEQRAAARAYVDKFYKPGKVSMFNLYAGPVMTDAFKEEVYVYSRKKYGGTV
ncbi:MAG: methyltransferase [Eubacteriaceae bacterium]|nr:methyltransferase [Eubacteriaceae bacterium]MBR5995458.1 methyltransferase [Eubacteriaceae bacterium]